MAETQRKSPGGYRKGREKRDEILEKALEVIGSDGYQKSTLRRLAEEVGLTNAGVLHHFASKEDLFTQILARRDEETRARTMDSETVVSAFVKSMAFNKGVPGLANLFNSLLAEAVSPEHVAHNFFKQRYVRLSEELSEDIQRQKPNWSSEKCLGAARLILASSDGLQAQWLLDAEVDTVAGLNLLVEELGLK